MNERPAAPLLGLVYARPDALFTTRRPEGAAAPRRGGGLGCAARGARHLTAPGVGKSLTAAGRLPGIYARCNRNRFDMS